MSPSEGLRMLTASCTLYPRLKPTFGFRRCLKIKLNALKVVNIRSVCMEISTSSAIVLFSLFSISFFFSVIIRTELVRILQVGS